MLKSVEGVYHDGKVELVEPVPEEAEGRVIVTFLTDATPVDLAERGIDCKQASDLRRRLNAFAEDWQLPEMDVFDFFGKARQPRSAADIGSQIQEERQ